MEDKSLFNSNQPQTISEGLQNFIDAMVEEIVLEGRAFDTQKKYLKKFSENEGLDYDKLEADITTFIEILDSLKTAFSKLQVKLAEEKGKECHVSEGMVKKLVGHSSPKNHIFFSVSSSRKVYFAKGNLQYHPSSNLWRIALNPWDVVGETKSNISSNYSGWIDLFGWGTGDNPTEVSHDDGDYYSFTDWGSKYKSGWRTLTKDEWKYVFDKRSTPSGVRYAKAKVNGVNGVILLPDDWSKSTYSLSNANNGGASFSSNCISMSIWNSTFSPAGAVFLPAAGARFGTSVGDVGSYGHYWSSSPDDSDGAYSVFFRDDNLNPAHWDFREYGFSVRPVCSSRQKSDPCSSRQKSDWCFRPEVIQASEDSYDHSGDVTFDDDAGHFDDYRSVRSVAGAYMRQEFVAVIIPDGTKTIPEKAFAFCENLKYVYVPDSVTLIEGGAFAGCKKLVEVSLPKGIEIKERCHEWWHEYEWNPYDDREHDDDDYYETFEDWSCLKYREQPLSADEWLIKVAPDTDKREAK